jgi:hypothetical protein
MMFDVLIYVFVPLTVRPMVSGRMTLFSAYSRLLAKFLGVGKVEHRE